MKIYTQNYAKAGNDAHKLMKKHIKRYLKTLDNSEKNEWYCTDRDLESMCLEKFMDWLKDGRKK